MDKESNPYLDFSENEQLIAEFDPDDVSDPIFKTHGREIQKHLRLNNPIATIKGLISYQILAAETNSGTYTSIARCLSHIRLILVVNSAVFLYVALLLSRL